MDHDLFPQSRQSFKSLDEEEYKAIPPTKGFSFIDLFAGIGGLRLAMESANGRCVFTSEWDRFARETYQWKFRPNEEIFGDITQLSHPSEIPDHDLLVAGFPCQPFSLAGVSKKNALGKKHGFADQTQGTLFFNILEILKEKKPTGFLLENVKNLRSHDGGKTFRIITGALEDLGYTLSFRVIDAAHFLPQHRERVIIVGLSNGKYFDFDKVKLPPYGKTRLSSILHKEDGSDPRDWNCIEGPLGKVKAKYTLSDKLWNYLQAYAAKHKSKGNGFGFGLVKPEDISRTLSARYHKDGSEILLDQGPTKNPRRLTPRECARLMGFEDDFEIVVSDTQAYRQFGNSVAIPVFSSVAKELEKYL